MSFYTNVECIGNNIFYRYVDNDGNRCFKKISNFVPSFFLKTKDSFEWKTINSDSVKEIKFSSIYKAKEWITINTGVENAPEMFGNTKFQYQYITDRYKKDIQWNRKKIVIFNIDIEVESDDGFPFPNTAQKEITAITIEWDSKYYSWSCGRFQTNDINIRHFQCENEDELLSKFISFWIDNCPDIVTGWNIKFFDIPYLINRIIKKGGKLPTFFSPYKRVFTQSSYSFGKVQNYYTILGVAILDYLELYKKFTYINRESYRLDYIANCELGKRKLGHKEIVAGYSLYKTDHQKFIEYNIQDCRLVKELDNKLQLLNLAIDMAYQAKCNYEDVFSPIKTWECLIYNFLHKKNITVPFQKEFETKEYAGAYVKDVIPGRYNWIITYDVASLYPNIIRSFNISPESKGGKRIGTNVEYILNECQEDGWKDAHIRDKSVKEENYSLAANGCLYSHKKMGFIPEIIGNIFNERVKIKNKIKELKNQKKELENDI